MRVNSRSSTSFSFLRVTVVLVSFGYSAWAIASAWRHGVLAWGALGEYSLFSYLLVLGMLCSGWVFIQGRSGGLRAAFILLFLGFGFALAAAQPVDHVAREMRWVFDFIGFTTGFAVIVAAIVMEQGVQLRRGSVASEAGDS